MPGPGRRQRLKAGCRGPLPVALGGDERKQADGTLLVVDAIVRVPIATTVTELDRVKITKQHGSTLGTALVFSVVGKPKRGPSALVIDLQRVTR